jgi:hypothetical protein
MLLAHRTWCAILLFVARMAVSRGRQSSHLYHGNNRRLRNEPYSAGMTRLTKTQPTAPPKRWLSISAVIILILGLVAWVAERWKDDVADGRGGWHGMGA